MLSCILNRKVITIVIVARPQSAAAAEGSWCNMKNEEPPQASSNQVIGTAVK
jgi:hypothetical protein